MQEYVSMLDEILDELEQLRFSIEYGEEFMEGSLALIAPMESGVKQLLQQIEDGRYRFSEGEYDIFDIAKNANSLILPFKHLVARPEITHGHGIDQQTALVGIFWLYFYLIYRYLNM